MPCFVTPYSKWRPLVSACQRSSETGLAPGKFVKKMKLESIFTLVSLHLSVTQRLLWSPITLDFPSVFQGAHADSCPTPLWQYDFPAQKMMSGFPRGAKQSRPSSFPSKSYFPQLPPVPFWFTCLSPCYPFCLSWPLLLISICGNPIFKAPFNWTSSTCLLSSLLFAPHPCHSQGTYHVVLCVTIFT